MSETRGVTVDQAAHLEAGGAVVVDGRSGRRCLNVPVFYPFQQDLTAGQSRLDLQQTVDADADTWLRGWKYVDTGGGYNLLVRLRTATGYYLANAVMPVAHLNLRAVTPELRIPAGQSIFIEATNSDVSTRRLKLIFFGVKRFFMD